MNDKRINDLLNRAGVPSVPKIEEYRQVVNLIIDAKKAVEDWETASGFEVDSWSPYNYINYLADIIDRLEWALNNTLVKLEEMSKDEK